MSLLIDLPPQQIRDMQPLCTMHESPVASSDDGKELMRLCEEVNRQWHDRISLVEFPRKNQFDFNHVPFRTAGKIKVRFLQATPMLPRRVDIE